MPTKLAYLVTHPIQYEVPMLRRIAETADIDLTVFFCSDVGAREYYDPQFKKKVAWDVPLLEGYKHVILPAVGSQDVVSWRQPLNYGLMSELRKGDFDVLWIHGYARLYSIWAAFIGTLLGIRVFIRDDVTDFVRNRGTAKALLKRIFFAVLNKLCAGFLTVGSNNREYYKKNGIPEEKLFLLPHSVDNDFFQNLAAQAASSREELRAELGLDPDRQVILFVGKFIWHKQPKDLLEAYSRLSPDGKQEPAPYLLYVGDGPLRGELEKRSNELDWDSIRFLGFKNQRELPRYYDLCNVFVLSSVSESWGLVINEVMNSKRAVITSNKVGCATDLVQDGVNGMQYEAGNIDDLHHALVEVLQDPHRCNEMGQKSFELIENWGYTQFLGGLREAIQATSR